MGNFPTRLLLSPDCADRLVVDLHSLGDLPIGLLRRGFDYLGDQLAPLLGGEMPAVDVGADDVGPCIIVLDDGRIKEREIKFVIADADAD